MQVLVGAPASSSTSHSGTNLTVTSPPDGGQLWKLEAEGVCLVTWNNNSIERFPDGYVEVREIPSGVTITAVA